MKRNAVNELKNWIEDSKRTAALITGMKGTGKTFLALDFAKSFFKEYIYINFETNPDIRKFFKEKAVDKSLLELLSEFYGIDVIVAEKLLFILDEISACKEAEELFYAYVSKDINSYLLAVNSFCPEGFNRNYKSLKRIKLYPIAFDEFLTASGHEWYKEIIQAHFQTMRRVPDIVHNELLTYFDDYLSTGGMPSVVNEFLSSESSQNTLDKQLVIYNSLLSLLQRRYSESDALKQLQVLNVIDEQLMKENKKFQYVLIRKGVTHKQYSDSINSLINNGIVYKANKAQLTNNMIEPDESSFRMYYGDFGFMQMRLNCEDKNTGIKKDLKQKAVIENYIIQSLHCNEINPYFWESGSQAKVDLVIEKNGEIVPIEIRYPDNRRSKSISVFKQKYNVPYSLRISENNFEKGDGIQNIPFYSAFCI